MTIQEVIKKLKTAGYTAEKRNRQSGGDYIAIVVNKGVDRPKLLKNIITPLFKGIYKSAGTFSKNGEVVVGNIKIVAKEISKVQLVGLDARLFVKGSPETTIKYNNEDVRCFEFEGQSQIQKSILLGCQNNSSLRGPVLESIQSFFKNGNFDWGDIDKAIVNKLAVYLGEVLMGWVGFSKNPTQYLQGRNPFSKTPTKFYIPNDPSFSGVDSLFKLMNGQFLAISNKSGEGRPASFFSNIMPLAMNSPVKGKTLNQLVNIVKSKGFKPEDSKSIVYEWGVNVLLHMRVSNPDQIVDVLKAGKKSKLIFDVASKLTDVMKKYLPDPSAKERINKLPISITSCFNYLLAKHLEDSIQDIENMVVAKDYYQANLNDVAFRKGQLIYSMNKAGENGIKMIFKQSSPSSITAREGWVSYQVIHG